MNHSVIIHIFLLIMFFPNYLQCYSNSIWKTSVYSSRKVTKKVQPFNFYRQIRQKMLKTKHPCLYFLFVQHQRLSKHLVTRFTMCMQVFVVACTLCPCMCKRMFSRGNNKSNNFCPYQAIVAPYIGRHQTTRKREGNSCSQVLAPEVTVYIYMEINVNLTAVKQIFIKIKTRRHDTK